MTKGSDYEVGYARPPAKHRFKPGTSGNPAGRPKGSRGVAATLQAALAKKVTVTQNGKRRSISLLEAAITQQANKAASGDRHAMKLIMDLMAGWEDREQAAQAGVQPGEGDRGARDKAILADFLASAANLVPKGAADDQS